MKIIKKKKWLPVLVSIVFAIVFLAGCGNNNNDVSDIGNISVGEEGGEESSASNSDAQSHFKTSDMEGGWPASDLPPGFPKYPGGDQYYEVVEDTVSIVILETDNSTFNDYMDTITSFGFKFEAEANEDGSYIAMMGSWYLAIGYYEEWDATMIIVADWGLGYDPGEWPAAIPAYPDGEFFVDELSGGSIWVLIQNTSRASMEKYIDTLTKAGWERSNTLDDMDWYSFEKDKLTVDLSFHDDDNSLSITIMEKTIFEDLPKEWPATHLPAGFPEYPEGNVSHASLGDDGSVYITIGGTSEKTMDAYKVTLENAGWSFDEKTKAGTWYGKKDGKTVSLMVSSGGTASILVS